MDDAEDRNLTGAAETRRETGNTKVPPPPGGNVASTNLNAHFTALQVVLPLRNVLHFSGQGDSHSMSAPTACRAGYQVSQIRRHENGSGSMTDDQVLEEAVVSSGVGLLFRWGQGVGDY